MSSETLPPHTFPWNESNTTLTPPPLTAQLAPEFAKRDVKLIGLSANDVSSHFSWIKDVEEVACAKYSEEVILTFPIIGDKDRKVATTYDMLDALDKTNVDAKGMPFTVRTVFISEFFFFFWVWVFRRFGCVRQRRPRRII